MMEEIYKRGPISCALESTAQFHNYTGGILHDTTGAHELTHEISVVGWGVENGVKYWIGRNSWGEFWGEKGMFKLVRGINNFGIETECSMAVPRDTWTADIRNTTKYTEYKPIINKWWNKFFEIKKGCVKRSSSNEKKELIKSPIP